MQKRSRISVVFFVLLILSIILFILSKSGALNGPESATAKIFSPFQSLTFSAFSFLSAPDSKIKKLENENKELLEKIINQDKLVKENKALRDQFETQSPKSTILLPANIVGAPTFIPGVTDPTVFIVDKGLNDRVKVGAAVVVKNILVGRVVSVNDYFSKVNILTSPSFSLTVKDLNTSAVGVVKGQGGRQMILGNVIQSQNLKISDILVTRGEQGDDGVGFPPDLIVGKLISVSKKPSEVFQKGEVQSPLDFSSLSTVFIISY